jgi:hypothetical protein
MARLCKVLSAFVVLQPSRTTAAVMQAKLLDIHRNTQHVRRQRRDRDLVLALNRSDYMLDEPSGTLMQVQLMAAWLCHSASARQAHTHTLQHTQAVTSCLVSTCVNSTCAEKCVLVSVC